VKHRPVIFSPNRKNLGCRITPEISKTESLEVQTMTGNIFFGAKKSSSQVGVVLD